MQTGGLNSNIPACNANIEELTAAMSAGETELAEAQAIRDQEATDLAASEGDL